MSNIAMKKWKKFQKYIDKKYKAFYTLNELYNFKKRVITHLIKKVYSIFLYLFYQT